MEQEGDFFADNGTPRSSIPPDLAPGMRIGNRYQLTRKIGSGSMGEVWAAMHVSLEEEVALKIVLRDVAHDDGSSADSRFLLEARVASQLSRKTRHIVHVTDHGEDGRYAYLAMELLEGESLDVRLARSGPMALAKVVPLIYQVARALAVAHGDGIVHRDLKPSNVFVTIDEEGKALIKILDFGIAKMRASLGRQRIAGKSAKESTMRGFLLGTPAYMSPEQARGRKIDHRADVWALAVIAYHLLTNEFPFDGETPEELFARLCRLEATPISQFRPDLPPVIADVFARAFNEWIDQRFQSAVAFAGALEQAETVQRRMDGALPKPLDRISLPPASERIEVNVPPLPKQRHATPPGIESSIAAAGVPRKQKLWPRLLAGVVVAGLLVTTTAILAVYFEREPAQHSGLASGPVIPEPKPSAMPIEAREPIPPIPPPAEAVTVVSSAAPPEPPPTAPVQPSATVAPEPVIAPVAPVNTPAAPSASAPPPKRGDKSEVF
jgi:serine/threonine-protein kinase